MILSDATIKDLLVQSRKLTPEKANELAEAAAKSRESLQDVVLKRKLLSEKDLTELYATTIKAKFIDLTDAKVDPKLLALIPERIARRYQAVVFGGDKNRYKLAIADPEDLPAVDALEKLLGKTKVELYIAPRAEIGHILDQYGKGELESEITKVIPEVHEENEEVSAEDVAEDSPVAKTVNLIIEYAIRAQASDIHIEPREDMIRVRYRVDGVLRDADKLPRKILPSLISRIKIMSNLKIDEHRQPQDGRFKIVSGDGTIAIRVSVMPVMDGEKIVMRLLDESSRALTLEELGFNSAALERMQRAMAQPHGMILVTGPTGSGKSTTLYSALSMLNTGQVNVATIEDPVEYRIIGANQTQVNPKAGMTFASGLRALLRQDPDIMMVGEIRDKETADLAIQAALTGHLVLSTLHTNNAATTLPRLLDMGAEPFLIASTVRVAVGQRLVRRLCSTCRVAYEPSPTESAQLKEQFQVEQAAAALKPSPASDAKVPVATDKTTSVQAQMSSALEDFMHTKNFKLWKTGAGCENCDSSGYKGRLGIYEVLEITDAIAQLIVGSATSDQLQAEATKGGMITMQTDGFIKSLAGLTTIEEVLRVTRE